MLRRPRTPAAAYARSGARACAAALVIGLSLATGALAQSSAQTPETPPAPDARDRPAATVTEQPWKLGVLAPPLEGSSQRRRASPSPWSLDLGLRGACPQCGDATSLEPGRNPNAPWSFRSEVSYASSNTRMTVGLTAARNYALPIPMFQPLGSSIDLTPPTSAFARVTPTTTTFYVSARVQQTLKRLSGGQTLGVVGDLFVPVTSEKPNLRIPDASLIPSAPSATGRLGVSFGF